MSGGDEIVGHKTFSTGEIGEQGFPVMRHEPLTRAEADGIWAAVEAANKARAEAMPTEQDAVRMMSSAFHRLKELGWKETMYASSEALGTMQLIEPGSSGIHVGHFQGEWPTGSWWIESEGDLWPSRPCLAKPLSGARVGGSSHQLQPRSDMTTEKEVAEKSAKDLAREYLMGELMSAATRQLRALDKPWLRLPEEKQAKVLRDVQDDIATAVRQAVEVIASDDRTVFRASVESVTFKDGVKAVLTMGNTVASHELADTAGGGVFVVIENPIRYTQVGDNAPKAESNQQDLVQA